MRLRFALLAVAAIAAGPAAHAEGVPVGDATEEQVVDAKEKFRVAREAYDDRRFLEAIDGFRASFDVVASPNTHLMIALAQSELGRYAEAYDELAQVEAEARAAAAQDAKYEEAVKLASDARAALRAKIVLVRVTMPSGLGAGAKLTVVGRAVPKEAWGAPIAVDPGAATLVLTDGDDSVVREIQADAGGEVAVSFVKERPEPQPSGGGGWQWTGTQRYIAYAVAGLGVGSLAATAVTGALALRKHDKLEDACGDAPCPERQSDIDEGQALQTASNVTLIVGLALLGGAVALWLTAPDENAGAAWGLRIAPGGMSLEGRF